MTTSACPHNGGVKRRCDDCRRKARRAFNSRLKWRQQMLAENPGIRPHGDPTTYHDWGCRCNPCRDAARAERYKYGYKQRDRLGYNRLYTQPSTTRPFGREWVDEAYG